MADMHSKTIGSYNMSRIKRKDTKPEMLVRRFLFAKGFRYRLHGLTTSSDTQGRDTFYLKKGEGKLQKKKFLLPGKPDIVLAKYKTVIFVHGCFWHGHEGCRYYVVPKIRTDWWLDKINRNKELDKSAAAALKKAGWKIITLWECDLKKPKLEKTLFKLSRKLS